jgi:hypothetical protein
LNLLRRGAASNSGASRGSWNFVSSNYNDEEEIEGEESDQSESEDDSELEEESEEDIPLPVKTTEKGQRKTIATSSKRRKKDAAVYQPSPRVTRSRNKKMQLLNVVTIVISQLSVI